MMEISNHNTIFKSKIIVLLEIDDATVSYDLASCLVDSGIQNLEIALRTPHSRNAAQIIKKNFNFVNVGLGTVTSLDDVNFAITMAAKFSFAPDCNPEILKACNANNLFFIPGISTAKEMQLAYDYGYRLFKFFPAESSGGILKLEALYNDFKDQNIGFIPSGGINAANMNAYLNKPFITGVAGSWIAPKALIKAKDWKAIAKNAKQALKNAAH